MGSFTQLTPEFFPRLVKGVVVREISSQHAGRVKFSASSWPAKLADADCDVKLLPEREVVIVCRLGNTLLVRAY